MKKRLFALLLLLALALSLAACSNEESDIPEGMKNATADGAPIRLYVPAVWNLHNAEGLSSAYYNLSTQSTVTAKDYPLPEGKNEETFWQETLFPFYQRLAGSLTLEPVYTDTVLDGVNAKKVTVTLPVKKSGENTNYVRVTDILAIVSGRVYLLSFAIDNELTESLAEDVERITDEFIIVPENPFVADDYNKKLTDEKDVPAGMQNATAYPSEATFFIPDTWKVDMNSYFSCGFVESDRANVTVIPFVVSTQMAGPDDYFTLFESSFKPFVENYVFTPASAEKNYTEYAVGSAKGYGYTYAFSLDGNDYRVLQIIVAQRTTVFNITYTARSADFESHLDDVNAILAAMKWR